jgi:hypothetical protein
VSGVWTKETSNHTIMSSWRGAGGGVGVQPTAENGPRAKCDQVVFEAIAKAAEIVVGSRCWIEDGSSSSKNNGASSSNTASGSGRFNLLVPEVQGVRYVLLFVLCASLHYEYITHAVCHLFHLLTVYSYDY